MNYSEALKIVLDQQFSWGTEMVALAKSHSRILAEPVHADRDQPPFDRVAMDGIAIDYAAYAAGRRHFPVIRMQPAGTAPEPLTDPEGCVEIMTGASLPEGATTVIRYEDLSKTERGFSLPEGIEDGKSIHRRGSDTRRGDLLLSPGSKIGPAATAILATCGHATVSVRKCPRVAIVSTGDEIVGVGEQPLAHQIRSSNVHQLACLFRIAGIEPMLAHLGDEGTAGRQRLAELLAAHELVILSGGVSKGKLDHVPRWLAECGVNKLFHRVAQRPGKPIWFGTKEGTTVFALPGNPVSSLVGALAYVGPWLRASLGVRRNTEKFELLQEVVFKPRLTLFQLVKITPSGSADPVPNAGSGDAASLLRGDGFLILPAEAVKFRAGERFSYIPISNLL